jgi:putative hydrolase of the HAD superfamily
MKDLCVVFDIDDTLYLERDYILSGFAALGPWVRTWLGFEDFPERCRLVHESGIRGSVINQVLEECGVTVCPEAISALVALYRAHIPNIHFCRETVCLCR